MRDKSYLCVLSVISIVTGTQLTSRNEYKYYTMEVYSYNFSNVFYEDVDNMTTLTALNSSQQAAVAVSIKITSFRFYGNLLNTTVITNGGFIFVGPWVHQYLTATQYIAPLMMTDFITKPGEDSKISYKELNDRFIVEWRNVYLKDLQNTPPFTFQAILHSNGTIVFAYKHVPVAVKDIKLLTNSLVKVGLSDGYYIDKTINGRISRTIVEYSKISINETFIGDNVAVIFHPEKTCNLANNCSDCVSQNETLGCSWCEALNRCSDVIDGYRQQWIDTGCPSSAIDTENQCISSTSTLSASTSTITMNSSEPSASPSTQYENTTTTQTTTWTSMDSTKTNTSSSPDEMHENQTTAQSTTMTEYSAKPPISSSPHGNSCNLFIYVVFTYISLMTSRTSEKL